MHTVLHLEALHPEHTFGPLPVGVRARSYEKNFTPARAALEQADRTLFCCPALNLEKFIPCPAGAAGRRTAQGKARW